MRSIASRAQGWMLEYERLAGIFIGASFSACCQGKFWCPSIFPWDPLTTVSTSSTEKHGLMLNPSTLLMSMYVGFEPSDILGIFRSWKACISDVRGKFQCAVRMKVDSI